MLKYEDVNVGDILICSITGIEYEVIEQVYDGYDLEENYIELHPIYNRKKHKNIRIYQYHGLYYPFQDWKRASIECHIPKIVNGREVIKIYSPDGKKIWDKDGSSL